MLVLRRGHSDWQTERQMRRALACDQKALRARLLRLETENVFLRAE